MDQIVWGVLGGGLIYVIAQALEKRSKAGENRRSAGGDGRDPDPRSWGIGPHQQVEIIARLSALERGYEELQTELTARLNRLAARQRRGAPGSEPDATGTIAPAAEPLDRKTELRRRLAAHNASPQAALLKRVRGEG